MAVTWFVGGNLLVERDAFWRRVRDGLVSIRNAKRLTQREVAERLGVAYETYRGWERGHTEVRLDRIDAIAAALGVSSADLLRAIGFADDPTPDGTALRRDLERLFGPEESEQLQRLLPALAQLPYNERQLVLRLIGAALDNRRSPN